MNPALWVALGSLASAVLMWLGARYTARASKEASQFAAAVGASEGIAVGYAQLTQDLRETIDDMRERLGHLETEMKVTKARYRAAVHYIRNLLDHINRHAPDAPPPDPPAELELK